MNVYEYPLDEHEIQSLVSQGNDEQLVRLVFILLHLPREQTQERYEALLQMGMRYVTLAQETNDHSDTIALSGYSERATAWCQEAISTLSTALQIRQSSLAYSTRGLARAIVNDKQALHDFTSALQFSTSEEERAYLYYLRGLASMQHKDYEQGINDLKKARALMPNRREYRSAVERYEEDLRELIETSESEPI
jgi:tetratricopeptide (TPR) repeat protein